MTVILLRQGRCHRLIGSPVRRPRLRNQRLSSRNK